MRILVVGEDLLSCAVAKQMVSAALPGWSLAAPPIDKKGVTKLKADLQRYIQQAQHMQPVLCIADTDGVCVKELLTNWLPRPGAKDFLLRFAVPEVESWILADRAGFSSALRVPINRIPRKIDEIADPKRLVLSVAAKSGLRRLREEMISMTDPSKTGTGYNVHLREFVLSGWDVVRACENSPSLSRSFGRLKALGLRRPD
jgi:hypothetical protein